ncbi:MAG TPA: SDR family NAD(P)-dependent oxidoreductase [Puia sp.]|nr:SDR family NAD(P)-dependent oxidoreductase [Puia sp.]
MNRTIFITGATSGFGEACARRFAADGDRLILTGRRKDRLERLQTELSGQTQLLPLVFDVQDRKAVFAAVAGLPDAWKRIDILINNAGLALGRDYFEEADLDDWETMMQTNVMGLLYVSRAVLPLMIPAGRGHIINMGSVAGKEVYERGNAYCGSKFAVDALSRGMRIDLLRHGIKVTAIHPGAAETEFSLVRFKGDAEQAKKVYQGFTPLSAEDVADVVHYCASLPPNVCINDLVLTPVAQADGIYFHKR